MKILFEISRLLTVNTSSNRRILSHLRNGVYNIQRVMSTQINEGVHRKYRKEDKVSSEFNLIYRAPMGGYLKFSNILSSIAVVTIPGLTLYSIWNYGGLIFPVIVDGRPMIRDMTDFLIFYSGFFFINLQIYVILRRYPLRIYSDLKGRYIGVFRDYFTWSHVSVPFRQGDLAKVDSSLPWGEALYKINKRKIFLLDDYFHRPADLNEMLESEKESTVKKNKASEMKN